MPTIPPVQSLVSGVPPLVNAIPTAQPIVSQPLGGFGGGQQPLVPNMSSTGKILIYIYVK